MTDPILAAGFGGALAPLTPRTPAAQAQALRQTAQDFEGLLLGQLLKSMRAGQSAGLLTQSQDAQTYRDMFDEEVGRSMAKAGGIGLARMILADEARRQSPKAEVGGSSAVEAAQRKPLPLQKVLKFPGATADTTSNGLTSLENGRLP